MRWGDTEHLLAIIADSLAAGNWMTRRRHFKGKPKPPKPLPRPGVKDPHSKTFGKPVAMKKMRKILDNWGTK